MNGSMGPGESSSRSIGARTLTRQINDIPEIKAVGVMSLFSHLDPGHEPRLKATFAEASPDRPVAMSYDALTKWKEHKRASTTLADAYIKPVVNELFRQMRWRFAEAGASE